jgi:hypothetical protein
MYFVQILPKKMREEKGDNNSNQLGAYSGEACRMLRYPRLKDTRPNLAHRRRRPDVERTANTK